MRSSHSLDRLDTAFDDEHLVADAGLTASPGYLRTLYKTSRQEKVHRHGVRSKFIVRPEAVLEVGNHNVWQAVRGRTRQVRVDPSLALVHHYRWARAGQ